jgi:CubicO group peptidase (beta-lactamase class C family)
MHCLHQTMHWYSRGLEGFILLFFVCATSYSGGQAALKPDEGTRSKIDAVIQRCLREDGTPSASVAIVQGDRMTYTGTFGSAVLHAKVEATEKTRYQLASISKTFVAQAALLLEADGKLSLDDKVSKWYPRLTDANDITLRELLNHTSGYPDHYPESYPAGRKAKGAAPDEIIEQWGHHPLLFTPGSQFHYSNLEYEIAGRIVEKVSGQPLFQFMAERIFRPLHMDATIDLDAIPEGSSALATGYTQTAFAPLEPAPYEGPGWSFGAGQVVTTAQDVARWDVAFLQRHVLPQKQAEEEVTVARLSDGSTYPYALGLFVSHEQGVLRYYHSGQGLGFEAINLIYPDSSRAIVILTNTSAKPTFMKIADELVYLLFPPTPDDQLARSLFSELQRGNLDESIVSENLRRFLVPGRLREYRSSLRPMGPVEAFSLARTQTADGLTTRDYDVVAGGTKLRFHLLLLPNNKVEDVSVSTAQ